LRTIALTEPESTAQSDAEADANANAKPDADADADADAEVQPKAKEKAPSRLSSGAADSAWKRWRLPLILVLLVCGLTAGALIFYQSYTANLEQERAEAVQAAARAAAASVSREVSRETQALTNLFDEEQLAALLSSDDAGARMSKQAEIAAAHDAVLLAWLVKAGTRTPELTSKPPLGYAAIEILSESETTGKAPPAEALLFGSDDQHILTVWRINAGDALVGHLVLAVDVSLLPAIMSKVSIPDGYAELIQSTGGGKPLVLSRGGDSGVRQGPAMVRIKVDGTPWRIAFWPGGRLAPPKPLIDLPDWAIPAAGGSLIVIILLVVVIRQRARSRVEAAAELAEQEQKLEAAAKRAAAKAAASPAVAAADGVESTYDGLDEATSKAGIEVEEEAGAMDMPAEIFRAYDIRGVVEEGLTVDIVRQIGCAIGAEAYDRGQQTLVVGRDGRNSGPAFQEALTAGLRSTGRDVIDVGRVPTPVLYFATHYLNTGSGVMVTGSHNPPEYNGFKIMLGGETLFGDDIQTLRKRAESGDFPSGKGNLQSMDVVDEYVRRVCEDVPVALGNSFRVVIDCGNGVAGEVAPKLLRALGHDVVELFCEVDGNFPNHHPDPSDPANLTYLIGTVKQESADLGFAFDGDGDRLGVVDPDGKIIWPDMQMMLFAKDVLSRNPGAEIVFDVKCSSRLPKVIKQLGGKPVMWRTGHSYIKNKLKESGAPLAGEMSGHIFFQDRWYGFDDAIYSAARMLEILMAFKKSPAEVFSRLPAGESTPELRVDMKEGEQVPFVEKLVAAEGFANGKRTTIDGLRVDFPDGWGLVRASNTTPSLVMRFEGDNKEALARIQDEFRKAVTDIDPNLVLPF
jgi:phosphomannomutase/phosphoglucomutase